MARVGIGTSGWSYAHWKDDFYQGLPSKRWLPHYAERFETVEVNASHYRLPRPATVAAWAEKTPEHFGFTFKVWRAVTHYNRLKGATRNLESFFEAIEPCPPEKRTCVLAQLPPMMHADPERLDAFLDEVAAIGGPSWSVAVEFRHPSWYSRETNEVLDRHGAALVVHDMPGSACWDPNDASFVYVRRHGGTGRYDGAYSEAMLGADAARIQQWRREGRDVLVYFNNDMGGHAPRDAQRLRALVDSFPPSPPRPRRPSQRARETARLAGALTLGVPPTGRPMDEGEGHSGRKTSTRPAASRTG